MSLQYLEALKALGAGPATKFVIPFEFTRLLEPFLDFVQPAAEAGSGSARPSATARSGAQAPPQAPPSLPPAGPGTDMTAG